MRILAAAVVGLLLLAGCAQTAPPSSSAPTSVEPTLDPNVRVLGDAPGQLPAAFGGGFKVAWKDIGFTGAEPNIGVTSTGSVFVSGFEANPDDPLGVQLVPTVLRSGDGGATWQKTENPLNAPTTLDPLLWVDPTTDIVYSSQLNLACAWLSQSADDGATWTVSPASCGLPGADHHKFATGPYAAASPFAALSNNPLATRHATFCYNKIGGTFCSVSVDGGLRFEYEALVDLNPVASTVATDRSCGGINGHQKYAPDGTIYVPYGLNCGLAFVAVSTDSGFSWTVRRIGYPQLEADPFVAVTDDGTAYYMWRDEDQRMKLVRSTDRFATFDGPFDITPPEVTGTVFAALTAGSAGRIAWAFLGHTTPFENGTVGPDLVGDKARWHLYAGMSVDADAEAPTFVTQQVTPNEDPLQIGPICDTGACRNHLDFIDMAPGPDGRFWVAFTDGCANEPCRAPDAQPQESRDMQLGVAWLAEGPALKADLPRVQ